MPYDIGDDFAASITRGKRRIWATKSKHKYGEKNALELVEAVERELLARFPKPDDPMPRLPFYRQPQTRSKWGWSGVSRTVRRGRGGAWEAPAFQVHISEDGERSNVCFYDHHYRGGEAEALRAATLYRIRWELEALERYEPRLWAWFDRWNIPHWPELVQALNEIRAERIEAMRQCGTPRRVDEGGVRRPQISRASEPHAENWEDSFFEDGFITEL